MANKLYTVMKDGKELQRLKTLTAAKKLADAEGAEVFSDGKCVYAAQHVAVAADPVVARAPTQPEEEQIATSCYRLKTLMNVRKRPSLESEVVAIKPAGTVVRVLQIENDWMNLADGNYILYKGGEFAEKLSS